VREAVKSDHPATRLHYVAKIARRIHDSLRSESEVLCGASAFAPDFVREKERIRYERQMGFVKLLTEMGTLRPEVTETAARDILWTLTSQDIRRRDWWFSGNGAPIDTNSGSAIPSYNSYEWSFLGQLKKLRADNAEIKVARKVLRRATIFDRLPEEPCTEFVAQYRS
jgi:hypothetical protein